MIPAPIHNVSFEIILFFSSMMLLIGSVASNPLQARQTFFGLQAEEVTSFLSLLHGPHTGWTEFNNFPSSIPMNESITESTCFFHFLNIMNNLKIHRGDYQSILFIDSFGKPSSGLLRGRLNWVGNQKQCEETSFSILRNGKRSIFRGKYCRVHWITPISNLTEIKHSTGACIPSSCMAEDFRTIKFFIENFHFLKIAWNSEVDRINIFEEKEWGLDTKIFLMMISTLLFLVILGSLRERARSQSVVHLALEKRWEQILKCFSLPMNLKYLYSVENPTGHWLALSLIRGLLAIGVVIHHTEYCYTTLRPSQGSLDIPVSLSPKFCLFLVIFYMGLFFSISGFLLNSQNFLGGLKRKFVESGK